MADERLRELERLAATGDGESRARLQRERLRRGEGGVSDFLPWREVVHARGSVAAWLPAEVSNARRRSLQEDLAPLDELVPGWSERALGFVLDGEDGGLLDEVARVEPRAGEGLGLKACVAEYPFPEAIRPAFQGGGSFAPPFLIRLGILYQACGLNSAGREADPVPATPGWLRILFWEASNGHHHGDSGRGYTNALRCDELEAALGRAGYDRSLLAQFILFGPPNIYQSFKNVALGIGGLGESLAEHSEAVGQALAERDAVGQTHVMALLLATQVDPTPWAPELVALACTGAGSLRSAALTVVRAAPAASLEPARSFLQRGKAPERENAAELVWQLGGEAERALLAKRASVDRSKRVRAKIQTLLATAPPTTVHAFPIDLPPRPGSKTRAVFELYLKGTPDDAREAAWEVIARPESLTEPAPTHLAPYREHAWTRASTHHSFAVRPDVEPVHLVRLIWVLGLFEGWEAEDRQRYGFAVLDDVLRENRESRGLACALPDLAAAFSASGLDPRTPGRIELYPKTSSREFSAAKWDGAAEYYAAYPDVLRDLLKDGLSTAVGSWRTGIHRELERVLTALDSIPHALLPTMLDVALGSSKTDRALAQRHLARVPDLVDLVLPALGARKQGIRIAAAEWLAGLGAREAITPLEEALAQEKRDKPRQALEQALARLRE